MPQTLSKSYGRNLDYRVKIADAALAHDDFFPEEPLPVFAFPAYLCAPLRPLR